MKQTVQENPICYRLSPDRRLLNGNGHSCHAPRYAVSPDTAVPDVPPCLMGGQHHTVVGLDRIRRVALMVNPNPGGSFIDQLWESISTMRAVLRQQGEPMAVTVQTVFLADPRDAEAARNLFGAYFGDRMPVTLFVAQPPCDGRRIAIEAWAVGTESAEVTFHDPGLVTVSYDGLEWIHVAVESPAGNGTTAYNQAAEVFAGMRTRLAEAGASFEDVVRTWLYQGSITKSEGGTERYRELNRARTDFFSEFRFDANRLATATDHEIYPASTGIGTNGRGLTTACLALRSRRRDAKLVSLENPLQVSSFDYPKRYSAKSPKFSRAMAVRSGDHLTTWISGTASIVASETVHLGDVEGQTDQTLTNIENLIGADNFDRAGWADAGASLSDLAKVRVYVKHLDDYEKCRAICEARLGAIPAIYAQADICRPDLLVEIEGVAFSSLKPADDDARPQPNRSCKELSPI